jgi:hypothetical protein
VDLDLIAALAAEILGARMILLVGAAFCRNFNKQDQRAAASRTFFAPVSLVVYPMWKRILRGVYGSTMAPAIASTLSEWR